MKRTNRLRVLLIATLLLLDFVAPSLAWWQSIQQVAVSGGGGCTPVLPLDCISTGTKADYSTRRLLTAYAGKSMNVKRASDSTTTDIGFVSNVFDTTSLNTFCSGTTCTVNIWYDQGGGGFDLTPGNGPIIYQSGAVTTINGKPAPLFVAASTHFLQNTSLTANPVNTLYQDAVVIVNSTAANGALVGSSGVVSLYWRTDAGGNLDLENAGVTAIAFGGTVPAATGTVLEAQYNSSTGALNGWIDRVLAFGPGNNPQSLSAQTIQVGAWNSGTEKFDGLMGEYITYDLVGGIPGASQTSIELNQKAYWGTP